MPGSELRARVTKTLLDFVWNEWAQMGVFADHGFERPWAQDPEALLLLTLEAGRSDARVFDETLDWLAANAALISQQRLRNLCVDAADSRLVDASLAWAGAHHPALRSAQSRIPAQPPADDELLFLNLSPARRPDPTFAAFGLSRNPIRRSGKSAPPRLALPINFAFRLRKHFGVGSRAEIVRFLLTSQLPGAETEVVRLAAGFSRANVRDAADSLVAAGAAGSYTRGAGGDRFYRVDVERWRAFLELERIPLHRDWPQLYGALRRLQRWLRRPDLDELSPYLRASEARQLMREIEPDLRYAGVRVSDTRTGADYWTTFVENVDAALSALRNPWP
jgi:hypothetical protein